MLRTLAALAALLLGAAGCARTTGPEAPAPPPQTTRWAAIVDADAHGAIVFDGQAYRGVRRDGRQQARVRAFDARGAVVWRRDVPAEVAVTADPTASRAAYLAEGTLQELDLRGGQAPAPLPGVLAARYGGAGGLVTVGAGGALTWRPAG